MTTNSEFSLHDVNFFRMLFFLEYARELRIFVLIERISRPLTSSTPHSEPSCEWLRYRMLGFLKVKEHLTTRPTQDKNKTYPSPMAWPALKELRLRAPARHQKWCSSLKAWNKLSKLGLPPSKTHAFRCFQMIQAPNMTKVLNPFRLSFWIFLTLFLHHSEKESSCLEGTQSCKPKLDRTRNQKSLVNTQVVSICWISSASWSQNK